MRVRERERRREKTAMYAADIGIENAKADYQNTKLSFSQEVDGKKIRSC